MAALKAALKGAGTVAKKAGKTAVSKAARMADPKAAMAEPKAVATVVLRVRHITVEKICRKITNQDQIDAKRVRPKGKARNHQNQAPVKTTVY